MHRLTRYSTRSLLVLVTLACVLLGWHAANVRAYRAERGALVRLERMHGRVHVRTAGLDEERCHVIPPFAAAGSATMEPVGSFKALSLPGTFGNASLRVTALSLHVKAHDVRVFEALSQFPHLTTVYVYGSHIPKVERERLARSLPHVTFDFGMMKLMDAKAEWESDDPTEL